MFTLEGEITGEIIPVTFWGGKFQKNGSGTK